MKKFKYIAMAFACLLFAACMGDGYADPDASNGPAVGNNRLEESNVITIAQLKEKFNTTISNSSFKQITDDVKISGIVTGNDFGGNLYQQICLQDKTGGILVKINKSGLYGELPVGQHVLIDCKNLYIGGYGKQAQLGGVYTNSKGNLGIGTMDRYTWNQHYKIIGEADPTEAEAMVEVFDAAKLNDDDYLAQCTGKLMRIEGVTFAKGDGKTTYAKYDGDGVSSIPQYFTGISSSFMVYTSSAAKFANVALPTQPVNVTGIFTRYSTSSNKWQILIRNIDDIQNAKGTEQLPYTVTEAIQLMKDGKASNNKVYTTGVICSDPSVATNYGNADYYISVDGKEYKTADGNYDPTKTIKVFRGYYLNGDKFTDENKDKIKKGQKVLIYGQVLLYNGVTPEINSGNYLISIQ